uniref:Uncharacterized protein n=2 Tax=Opuntia streptacantha TaxID=393608 RepID=A0A7C8Z6N0_OPUST
MIRMDDDLQSWKPMEPNLKRAACEGDVEFLTKAVGSGKGQGYWLSRFTPKDCEARYAGNILHLAVWHAKEDFVKEVIRELPEVVVSRLLRHQEPAGELHNRTPALLAIERGESLIAEILTCGSRAELIQGIVDDQGNSPLFLAVKNGLDNVVTNSLNYQGALFIKWVGSGYQWLKVYCIELLCK